MKRLHPSNVLDLLHSTNSMSVTNGAIRTFFLYGALAKMVNGLCDAPFTTDRVSPECKRDYQLFYDIQCGESETKNVPWANKMADAYGNWPREGILEGNRFSLGSYYSCMELEANVSKGQNFLGKYAHLVTILGTSDTPNTTTEARNAPLVPPFGPLVGSPIAQVVAFGYSHQGICVPSTCTDEDIKNGLEIFGDKQESQLYRTGFLILTSDSHGEKTEFTGGDIAFLTLMSTLLLLVLTGTTFDALSIHKKRKGEPLPIQNEYLRECILGFSFYSNTKKLLDTSSAKTGQITCLNGIRFWSMTWVLITHVYSGLMYFVPRGNSNYFLDEMERGFGFRVILNGYPCVDSFFLLSGCLLGFLTFKELDRTKGRLNVLLFYLHRYLRLTMVYALVVAFYASVWKFFATGVSNINVFNVKYCTHLWWKNLLYINNFADPHDQLCLGQTWYLAVEMQIFLCTPFVLLPMWWIKDRYGLKWSLILPAVLLLGFTSLSFGMTITHDWPVSGMAEVNGSDYSIANYVKPWHRCQPYIVGIGLGLILHSTKKTKLKLNWLIVSALWAVAFAIGLAVVYGIDVYGYEEKGYPSVIASAFYNGYSRMAWALAMSWLIFACYHGYGGFIDSFLSWEAFGPLGRLAFNIYLIHLPMVKFLCAQIAHIVMVDHLFATFMIIVVLVYATIFSFFLSVLVEIPLLTAEKIFFAQLLNPKKDKI